MEENHPVAERFELIADSLMRQRTVILTEINGESISDIMSRLLLLQIESSEPITMLIDSGGGDPNAAFLLCDAMEHLLTAAIRGIAVGSCGSAATFIMLYCNERLATPYSKFLIHSGRVNNLSVAVNGTTGKILEQLLSESKQLSERVIRMYMDKLRKTRKQVEKLMARGDQAFDQDMTAEEAKKIGLIQQIIEGKLDIFSNN